MKPSTRAAAVAATLLALAAGHAAAAEPAVPPLIPTWNAYLDELRDLAPKMLAKLPPRVRDDPQVQQEVGRLMLEAVAARSLDAIAADGDRPMFLPSLNVVLNILQPNADTVYKQAVITPGGSYRLRGRKGSLRIATLGTMSPPSADGKIRATEYFDLNKLPGDADGAFDVLLSPTKPAGYKGVWWKLDPRATTVLLRQVSYDWAKERDPVVSIERVDVPAPRPRPSGVLLDERLRRAGPATGQTAMLLIDHVEQLRRDGAINRFQPWDVVSNYGGLFGQFYYETAYEVGDDEALIVEAQYPKTCAYASMILTNDIFETTDWYNNHSSLNGAQWQVNADGKLRVVVSARDPGVQNWLDTAGHPTGVIQGRWTECEATPLPSMRKVPLSEVSRLLPRDTRKVTPAERDRIVRDRRAAFQQRVLW
jgi:hypothetical protein